MQTDDLRAKLEQLRKDLADHRQLNLTQSHGEGHIPLAIEAELERQIEELEKLIAQSEST